jgi:anoctamin-7
MDFEDEEEQPRSEFTIKAKSMEKNPITGKMEPSFPKNKKIIRMLAGFATVLCMVSYNHFF